MDETTNTFVTGNSDDMIIDTDNSYLTTLSDEEAETIINDVNMYMDAIEAEQYQQTNAGMDSLQQDDYDRLVPKNIHNAICYDEAVKNNEKIRKASKETISEIIPNNSLVDVLDEGSAASRINQFDLGDISQYLEDLRNLSFFEAVSLRKDVDAEYVRWKSCNSMLNAVKNLKLEDGQNRQLMELNTLEDYKFTQSLDEFDAVYESNISKYEQIIKVLDEIINDNRQESTTFLTNELIHMITTRLEKLPKDTLNYDYNVKKMNIVLDAFSHRENLQYLREKFNTYLTVHKKKIKSTFKNDAKDISGGRHTKVINDLIRMFSKNIAEGYYQEMMEIFNNDVDTVYLMTCYLIKIMNSEKESGKNTYAKVFIMNLSDIHANIYDYDDSRGVAYKNEIKAHFSDTANKFLKNNHLTLNCNKITI